jgi:hypothetical protein
MPSVIPDASRRRASPVDVPNGQRHGGPAVVALGQHHRVTLGPGKSSRRSVDTRRWGPHLVEGPLTPMVSPLPDRVNTHHCRA